MTDKTHETEKPSCDAKGREVFSMHPEILAGGADYRKVDGAKPNDPKDL